MTYFKTEYRKALSMLLAVLLVFSLMAITTLVPVSAAEDNACGCEEASCDGDCQGKDCSCDNDAPNQNENCQCTNCQCGDNCKCDGTECKCEGCQEEAENDCKCDDGEGCTCTEEGSCECGDACKCEECKGKTDKVENPGDDEEEEDNSTPSTTPGGDTTEPGEEEPGEEEPGTGLPETEVQAPPVSAETGEDGKASAEVKGEDLDAAIDEAVAEAEAGESAPTLVIPVEVADDAKDLEVEVPASSIKKLAEAANTGMKVTSKIGDVKLDHTALKALADRLGANDKIVLEINTSENAVHENAAQSARLEEAMSEYAVSELEIIDVSLLVNDTPIHDFGNGGIEISVRYTLPADAVQSAIRVYYMSDKGVLSRCGGVSYADGKVTFTTTHLSMYVISPKAILPEFTDVAESEYYYEPVQWAIGAGITEGRTETLFMPDDGCTRAQFVTFLWRAYGKPAATGTVEFTDIDASEYYYDALVWAVTNGITTGTGDGTTFSPDEVCTRAQAVTFMHRAAGEPQAAASSFTDVPAGEFYTNAVSWAVANGITNGSNDAGTTFSPYDTCLRGQLVTFLYREFGSEA